MTEDKEIWKDIPGYEGLYRVSIGGTVKSLERWINAPRGKKRLLPTKIKSPHISVDGYYKVLLSKEGVPKQLCVHQLVAMAFLGHVRYGMNLVVNHKNFNRLDNRVENLEIVTMRVNGNKKHLKSSSKYTGVCWCKQTSKWRAKIIINKKSVCLGRHEVEYEAHLTYQRALKYIKKCELLKTPVDLEIVKRIGRNLS